MVFLTIFVLFGKLKAQFLDSLTKNLQENVNLCTQKSYWFCARALFKKLVSPHTNSSGGKGLKLINRRQSLAVQKLPRAIAKWWPRVQPFSRVGWFSDGCLVSVRYVWWNLRLVAQCLFFNFGQPFSFAEQIMTRVKVTEGPSGEGKAVEVPLLCSPSHVPRLCTFYPSRFRRVYDPLR